MNTSENLPLDEQFVIGVDYGTLSGPRRGGPRVGTARNWAAACSTTRTPW